MRDLSARHWLQWRITLASQAPAPVADWSVRLRMPAPLPAHVPCTELPGEDGIRHELVARIRQEIAAGTYDTEEKWLAAEEAFLRRIEERI